MHSSEVIGYLLIRFLIFYEGDTVIDKQRNNKVKLYLILEYTAFTAAFTTVFSVIYICNVKVTLLN